VINTIKAENLPRYSQQRLKEPSPFLLRVVFEPSSLAGLRYWFSFFCQGEVVDQSTNQQEISIRAAVSESRDSIPTEPDARAKGWDVRGALIEQDIRAHVQQGLVIAYSLALDVTALSANGTIWLALEEAK
jgi:hypothetical protein